MRKLLIPLLLAGAMAPAAAHAAEGRLLDGFRAKAERSERARSSEDRPQRAQRADRPQRAERPARVERQDRQSGFADAVRQRRLERQEQQVRAVEPVQPVRRIRRSERDERNETLLDGFRSVARQEQAEQNGEVRRDRDRDRRWSGRDGNWRRDRDGDRRWSGDWRRDRRYNWRDYRYRHGSLFRLGRYYDPYGYNYRRFSIGFNLWPSYYGSSFWLHDPWQYRLPPAYGPYRWVRYYDDALLVNIYTGRVVDVIHNFFW